MTAATYRAIGAALVSCLIAPAVTGQEAVTAAEATDSAKSYLSVTELQPNPDSAPSDLVSTPLGVFFSADDGLHGRELWVYEPALGAARLVRDIRFGREGSAPDNMIWFKDRLYFSAYDGIHDRELWWSDGTAEGTELFVDLAGKGYGASKPERFRVCGDYLIFFAWTPQYATEPWSTDGTVEGTRLLRDFNPGGEGMAFVIPDEAREGQLFLGARTDHASVWVTDGTPEGLRPIHGAAPLNLDFYQDMLLAASQFLIMSAGGPEGREPYVIDYATEEIALLKDIHPSGDSDASLFVEYEDYVYFQAKDGVHGAELWRTDGTEAGTELFYDIYPGTANSSPFQFEVAAGRLCFTVRDGVHGREVWVTDGTREGTGLLKDINPGVATAEPYQLTAFGEYLAFSADHDKLGEELWLSDGTREGTRLLRDINPGPGHAEPYYLTVHDDLLYFSARDDVHGAELWRTDGTAEGTQLAADIAIPYTPPPSSEPFAYVGLNNAALFFAKDGPDAWRLHRSDGTEHGTYALDASPVINEKQDCMAWQSAGNMAWYVLRDQGRKVLWQTDGTEGGTRRIGSVGAIHHGVIGMLTESGFYYCGWDKAHGPELWSVGENGQARLVADLNAGPPGSGPFEFGEMSGTLLCIGSSGTNETSLWRLDNDDVRRVGTWPVSSDKVDIAVTGAAAIVSVSGETGATSWQFGAGDNELQEIAFGGPNDRPLEGRNLMAMNGAVYFAGYRPETGTELWRIDLAENRGELLHDAYPGPASGNPQLIGVEGDRLFYSCETPAHGVEIWSTDGRRASTNVLTELIPGSDNGSPTHIILDDGRIIGFGSYEDEDFIVSRQLFVLTADGEPLHLPLLAYGPGVTIDESAGLTAAGRQIFFTATDPIHGNELWVCQPGDIPARVLDLRRAAGLR